jgi:ParB-like chromosome segregation protein Spo0J
MRGLLAEIGYADALLARELPDGTLELIDGHLRAETTPDVEVPVLVLDLDEREAAKLLALHDPLAEMAEADQDVLADLIASIETENEALQEVLERMLWTSGPSLENEPRVEPPPEVDIPEIFQVVVECSDEEHQRAVYERLTADGLACKLLTL